MVHGTECREVWGVVWTSWDKDQPEVEVSKAGGREVPWTTGESAGVPVFLDMNRAHPLT